VSEEQGLGLSELNERVRQAKSDLAWRVTAAYRAGGPDAADLNEIGAYVDRLEAAFAAQQAHRTPVRASAG
jgi:hypothetical protein